MRTRNAIAFFAVALFGVFLILLQQPGVEAAAHFSSPLAQPQSTPTPHQMERVQPPLANLLRKANGGDQIPVVVWMPFCTTLPTDTEIWNETVRIHAGEGPDAQERILIDPMLWPEAETTSRRLLIDAINICVAPLIEWLTTHGIEAEPSEHTPAVFAIMTKAQIEEASAISLVAAIDLDQIHPFATPIDPNLVTPVFQYGPAVVPTPTPGTDVARAALLYIANHESIPLDELYVGSESSMYFQGLARTYHYVSVVHNVPYAPLLSVLVDPETLEIESDLGAIEQADREAYAAKYGRLDPSLYDRLQNAGDDEILPVIIWVTFGKDVDILSQLEAETRRIHPDAAPDGAPWVVEDRARSSEIKATYKQLLKHKVSLAVKPMVEWLEGQGVKVEYVGKSAPTIGAQMTKAQILQTARHPETAEIFLQVMSAEPQSDMGFATSRTPWLWQASLTGTGVSIALVEPGQTNSGTNIGAPTTGCINLAAPVFRAATPTPHESIVAAILSCNNSGLPGGAVGATIFDGGFSNSPSTQFDDAVDWAVDRADIVNMSMATRPSNPNENTLQHGDRLVDYYSRVEHQLFVVAAGNTTRCQVSGYNSVGSPGKAWNVLTVGNFDDKNSAAWSTAHTPSADQMNANSSYINPNSGSEKPDVVAPGTFIRTVAGENSGTSFAAPQVASLAALLMKKNSQLFSRPELVRAIIIASAVENISGPRDVNTTQDLSDGAGGVNGRLALSAAETGFTDSTSCSRPSWWSANAASVNPGATLTRQFHAVQGERIRVALAWNSYALNPHPTDTLIDFLDYRFALQVLSPTGQQISGASSDYSTRSEQLVEFVAPQTGTYTIRSTRSSQDSSTQPNQLGIAWVSDSTFIPDVRGSTESDQSGWKSTISIRNDGVLERQVRVTFIPFSGTAFNATNQFASNATWSIEYAASFAGSVVIDGGEDLSVVVVHRRSIPFALGAYTGITLPSVAAHISIVQRGNSGINSEIYIQNTSAAQIQIEVHFRPSTGNSCDKYYTIAGGATLPIYLASSDLSCLGAVFIGSVYVTNGQNVPIAVSSTQANPNSLYVTDNGAATTQQVIAPLVQNNNPPGCSGNCWKGGIGEQNVSSTSNTLRLTLVRLDGGSTCTNTSTSILPYRSIDPFFSWIVYPLPCTPGSTVTSAELTNDGSSGTRIAANLNQIREGSNAVSTYPAVSAPLSRFVSVPRVLRQSNWNDALAIRNVLGVQQNVNALSYDSSGNLLNNTQFSIAPNGLWVFFPPIANTQSVVVVAPSPFAVTVNNWNTATGGDDLGTYTPVHR